MISVKWIVQSLKKYYFEPADIIVFPVIDWHYRFQRPQQISTRLAVHGHRVFYLRTYFMKETKPIIQPIRNDIPLFDLQLGLLADKNLVADQLDESSKRSLLDQFDFLRENLNISKALCLVDLPFWGPLVLELKKTHGWKIIYNAMDQLGGFSNITSYMLEPEVELVKKSDLVLATSHLLLNEKARFNTNCLLLPNGTEFDHFNYSSENVPEELINIRKPIVGYYGAISDWLDTELIYNLASARLDWNFILIGRIENASISQLKRMSNVFLLGEKPYELLPGYLQNFDTCIIPFKKIPLTEATNPVKLFEYLSAGKSVVATDLNELRYYKEYVRLASSLNEWLEAIEHALSDYSPTQVNKRLSFARQNTWDERLLLIEDAIQSISQNPIGVSAPLPLIFPHGNLVSAQLLTQHEGVDYWCLMYEKDGMIYKQSSFDLAAREARFLSQWKNDYFPHLLDVQSEGDYSVITFKKIQGQNLSDALPAINVSIMELYNFIQYCLDILMELNKKGVTHRNIRRENILVQAGKPVLLDFSWAVSEAEPYFSPLGLGGYERSPGSDFSDIYSMGKILAYVNRPHYQAFDQVISLMTSKDAQLRITDLNVLRLLFNAALKMALESHE